MDSVASELEARIDHGHLSVERRSHRIDYPGAVLLTAGCSLIILGLLYGLCMGLFSVIASGGKNYAQLAATTFKVPALFFLTLLVTFPSLYVFNALVGSRLRRKANQHRPAWASLRHSAAARLAARPPRVRQSPAP